jgi:hypothetical protein
MVRRTAQKAITLQGNDELFRDAGEIFVICGGPSGRHSPPALSLDFFLPGFKNGPPAWPSPTLISVVAYFVTHNPRIDDPGAQLKALDC